MKTSLRRQTVTHHAMCANPCPRPSRLVRSTTVWTGNAVNGCTNPGGQSFPMHRSDSYASLRMRPARPKGFPSKRIRGLKSPMNL